MLEKVNHFPTVDMETQLEIMNFLHQEAYLLDQRRYNDWLEILADDLVYRMPARITNEGKHDDLNVDDISTYFEDTKKSLETRIKRLETSSAWAEFSGPLQRHFISNILVTKIEINEDYEEYHVNSNFLFKREKRATTLFEELFGERKDILRKRNGNYEIAERTILLDQYVLGTMNLSMFL